MFMDFFQSVRSAPSVRTLLSLILLSLLQLVVIRVIVVTVTFIVNVDTHNTGIYVELVCLFCVLLVFLSVRCA